MLGAHAIRKFILTELPSDDHPGQLSPPAPRRCEVTLNVPRKRKAAAFAFSDVETESCCLTDSGDCAAAHARGALTTPVCRIGCCFRCTLAKKDWLDDDKIATARMRNFVYQCAANHINPWPLLPGFDADGKLWSARPAPNCPHCGVPVDADLMAADAKRLSDAPTIAARNDIVRAHIKGHAGGMIGCVPVLYMDNKWRSRGLLHRRMNVVSNCIAATIMRVKFSESKRRAMNKLLGETKMIWRCPESSGKRPKTIAAGNDARRLLTDEALLTGLLKIAYAEEVAQLEGELGALGTAAAANANVRSEEQVAAEEQAAAEVVVEPTRTSAVGVQPAIAKKTAGGRKKKAVAAVVGPSGVRVTESMQRAYVTKRNAAAAAVASTAAPEAALEEAPAPNDGERDDGDGQQRDTSLDGEDEDMEEEEHEGYMAEAEEDEKAGGLATAIETWLTAIRYMADLHETLDDPFDKPAVAAFAAKVGASGKLWALAINNHTSNKAMWQV